MTLIYESAHTHNPPETRTNPHDRQISKKFARDHSFLFCDLDGEHYELCPGYGDRFGWCGWFLFCTVRFAMDFYSGQKDGKQGYLARFPGQLAYMKGFKSGEHYRRLAEIQRIRNLDAMAKARAEREQSSGKRTDD